MRSDFDDFSNFTTPVEHHLGLLNSFPGNENKLWILHYLVQTYNIAWDAKYDAVKQGWTYRIAGAQPTAQGGKLVYFSRHEDFLNHAHNTLHQILINSTDVLAE